MSYIASLIYKQFILPLCNQADFVFESAPSKATDQLDKIQNRSMRIFDRGLHKHSKTSRLEAL